MNSIGLLRRSAMTCPASVFITNATLTYEYCGGAPCYNSQKWE
jgi:hypothetical protein